MNVSLELTNVIRMPTVQMDMDIITALAIMATREMDSIALVKT